MIKNSLIRSHSVLPQISWWFAEASWLQFSCLCSGNNHPCATASLSGTIRAGNTVTARRELCWHATHAGAIPSASRGSRTPTTWVSKRLLLPVPPQDYGRWLRKTAAAKAGGDLGLGKNIFPRRGFCIHLHAHLTLSRDPASPNLLRSW